MKLASTVSAEPRSVSQNVCRHVADPITPQPPVNNAAPPTGLASDDAGRQFAESGPNAAPTALRPLRRALTQFWAPVP
jgi:hypothetical protein